MNISDDYINGLFKGTCFGDDIDNNIEAKNKLIKKTLRNLMDGYWAGHTAYHLVVHGGFIKDGKRSQPKVLTAFGDLFMSQFN